MTTGKVPEDSGHPIQLDAIIERKQPDLPRFVVIPSAALADWALTGTTAVEVLFNGVPMERRTIKYWDADRWFLSVTQDDCRRLGVDTGATLAIRLALAPADLPSELSELLATSRAADAAWQRLTESQRRMLAEEVRRAKTAETRERRVRKALLDFGAKNRISQ